MRNEKLKKLREEIPLKTRFKSSVQHGIVDFLTEAGFRKNKAWDENENELLKKINKASEKIATDLIINKNKWEHNEVNEETQLFRRKLHQFFRFNDWQYETTITDVKILENNADAVTIEITTHRPGILIGKAGHFIDSLIEYLNEDSEKEIKISIKECQLWNKLY